MRRTTTASPAKYQGGPTPDGYLREVKVGPNQKPRPVHKRDPARRVIFERIQPRSDLRGWETVEGEGEHEMGYRRKRGTPWTRRAVQSALTNPFYAGLARYKNEEPTPGGWPAYVTPEDFARVQALAPPRDRDKSGKPKGGKRTTRFLLARLGNCGSTMYSVPGQYVSKRTGTKRRHYVCTSYREGLGCDQPKIDAEVVDRAVIANLDRLAVRWDEALQQGAAHLLVAGAALSCRRRGGVVQRSLGRLERGHRPRRVVALSFQRLPLVVEETILRAVEVNREKQADARRRLEHAKRRLAAVSEDTRRDLMLDVWSGLKKASPASPPTTIRLRPQRAPQAVLRAL